MDQTAARAPLHITVVYLQAGANVTKITGLSFCVRTAVIEFSEASQVWLFPRWNRVAKGAPR